MFPPDRPLITLLKNRCKECTNVITGNEAWLHYFDPLPKSTTNWKKISQTKFAGMVMMIIFFDNKGVSYYQCGAFKNYCGL